VTAGGGQVIGTALCNFTHRLAALPDGSGQHANRDGSTTTSPALHKLANLGRRTSMRQKGNTVEPVWLIRLGTGRPTTKNGHTAYVAVWP
jgi:hypothetical protein